MCTFIRVSGRRLRESTRALAVVLCLVIVPISLGRRLLSDVLESFHWDVSYLGAELGPWLLMLAGVAFLLPVAVSAALDPENRLYPRVRRAYFIWGIVLYLLGAALTVELFDVWGYEH